MARPLLSVFIALLAVATGCSVLTEGDDVEEMGGAIVGGTDSNAVLAVGYLTFEVEKDGEHYTTGPFCTGTLIAPDVVLTAAHCFGPLDDSSGLEAQGYTIEGIAFGTGTAGEGPIRLAKTHRIHPEYEPQGAGRGSGPHGAYSIGSAVTEHDVAFLVLERPLSGVPLARVRRSSHRGHCDYVAIGYGVNKAAAAPDAEREAGEIGIRKMLALCADAGRTSDGMIEAYSGGRGTACYGDSGGALRVKNSLEIVGIASYISDHCNLDTRIYYAPLASNLTFIDEALAQSAGE